MKLILILAILPCLALLVNGYGRDYGHRNERWGGGQKVDSRVSSRSSQGKSVVVDEVNDSSSSSSSEESAETSTTTTTTANPRSSYRRRGETEALSLSPRPSYVRRRRVDQPELRNLELTSDGATVARQGQGRGQGHRGTSRKEYHRSPVLAPIDDDDDSSPTPTPTPGDPSNYKLRLREGRFVQFGDDNNYSVWPRLKDGSEGAEGQEGQEQSTTTTRTAAPYRHRHQHHRRGPGRLAPRLDLKSGDNVQFGDDINWEILRSERGLTRIGKKDGEVVVRVVRPNRAPYRRRWRATEAPEEEQEVTTAEPPMRCQMGQDCHETMLNYYDNHRRRYPQNY